MKLVKGFCLHGLYGITPNNLSNEILIERIELALLHGLKILQYRNKGKDVRNQVKQASAIKILCQKYNVPLIINDNVDIALEVNAEGLHIGKDDVSLNIAREKLGDDVLIGVSCYGNLKLAEESIKLGADYVAFGSFFKSLTKPDAPTIDENILQMAREKLRCPIVAIGGITPENGLKLVKNGADMLAVINTLFSTHSYKEGAKKMAQLFEVNLEKNK